MTPTRRQEIEATIETLNRGYLTYTNDYAVMLTELLAEADRLTASHDALTDAYAGAKRDRDTAMKNLDQIEQVCKEAGIATDDLMWVEMVKRLAARSGALRA